MDVSNRYKHKHRTTLFRRLIFWCLFILFLCVLFWGSFWVSFFRVTSITTTGIVDPKTANTLVAEYLKGVNRFFVPKNNFFTIDTDTIAQFLKERDFGVALVKKSFPRTILISFPEREARFIICAPNDICYYINEDGLLYSEAPQFSEYPLPLIVIQQTSDSSQDNAYVKLGDYFTDANTMHYLNTLMRGLPTLDIKVKIIEISNINQTRAPFNFKEIKIFTPKEWYLYLNTETAPENILNNIKLLFEQKIKNDRDKLQYVDLRFENKAFYMLQ